MTLYCLEKAPKTHAVRNIGELLIKEREAVLWMLGLSDSLITVIKRSISVSISIREKS